MEKINELPNVQIEYSEKKRILVELIIPLTFSFGFVNLFLLIWFLLVLILEGETHFFFLYFLLFLTPFELSVLFVKKREINNLKPFQEVKFSISNITIDIYLQKRLYLQFFWNEIKKIEFVKVKWEGYKLNFIGINESRTVRLFLLVFIYKKQKLIVKELKRFSKYLNKEVIEFIQRKKDFTQKEKLNDKEEEMKETNEIKNFKIYIDE